MSEVKKVVLAYSGGLDTSIIIPWLKEHYNNCEVIAVCGNVGQKGELEGLEERAKASGASKLYIEDLTDEFVEDYVIPTMQAGADYEGYLLGTSFARPILAKRVVEIARAEGADAVCHGSTGKGNDQVRFELAIMHDEVILSYDSDEAGQKATLRSLELFRNSPVKVGVLQIPGAKDPDEYIKKYGPERFQALLDGVGNALDFRLKRLRDQYDLSQDAQRLQYVKEAVEMLAERSNPTEQEVYAGRLAEDTNISKTAILAQLGTAAKLAGGKYRREKNRELL